MKKKLFLGFILFMSMSVIAVDSFWPGKVLSVEQVQKKWGNEKFDVKKFHDGSVSVRASMTYDLLKRQNEFFGKKAPEIRALLGDFSGYYFSDVYATYIVEEGSKIGDDVWQIVFLIDRDRKIKKIIVNKN